MIIATEKRFNKKLFTVCFIIYLVILFKLILFRASPGMMMELFSNWQMPNFQESFNIVPFFSIRSYIEAFFSNQMSTSIIMINLIGNVLAFVPWGILLPLVGKKHKSCARVMLISLIFILCIEIAQFFSRMGSFDIDDLILNLAGTAIGYAIYRALAAKLGYNRQRNIFS